MIQKPAREKAMWCNDCSALVPKPHGDCPRNKSNLLPWCVCGHHSARHEPDCDGCDCKGFQQSQEAWCKPGVPPAARPPQANEMRELVKEASEIMQITYAGNFPAGIESFLVRAERALAASPVVTKQYPCGCSATGAQNLPDYCPEHGQTPARPHPADSCRDEGHPWMCNCYPTANREAAVVRCMHSRFTEGCLNCALRDREALQEMVLLLKQIHGDTRNRYELRAATQASGRADREKDFAWLEQHAAGLSEKVETAREGQEAAEEREERLRVSLRALARHERDVVQHQGGHYGEESWTEHVITPCETGAWVKWSDVAALLTDPKPARADTEPTT